MTITRTITIAITIRNDNNNNRNNNDNCTGKNTGIGTMVVKTWWALGGFRLAVSISY